MRAFRLFPGLFLALGAAPALAQAPAAAVPPLSAWSMFLGADMVVQTVMVGLMAASVATWTVWLAKALEVRAMRRHVAAALDILAGAPSLAAAQTRLRDHKGAAAEMVAAAANDLHTPAGLHRAEERIATRLDRQRIAAGRGLMRGTGILATIGSTAPFIGLFGTVWGIMNSFVGIAQAQTTNLAVVAPGIAEALLATAAGLVAAIPAVVAYNAINRSVAAVKVLLGDCVAEVRRLAAHDIDQRMGVRMPLAAE